jgi:uncharacterized protein
MRRINLPSVVMPLIMINILMFILQISIRGFTQMFMLVPGDVLARPWIVITSMFLHSPAGFSHIFFNMYGLLIFGPILEQKIGPNKFLMVYLVSGIMAALGHIVLSVFFYGTAAPALGASGAIMGMLGALILLMPNLRLLFLFFIPMPLWMAGIAWAVIDTVGIFIPTGIANLAHLAGMATGLLFGIYFLGKREKYKRRIYTRKTHMDINDMDDYLKHGRI